VKPRPILPKRIALHWANLKIWFLGLALGPELHEFLTHDILNQSYISGLGFPYCAIFCGSRKSFLRLYCSLAFILLRTQTEELSLDFNCAWCWHVLDGCQTYSQSSLPFLAKGGLLCLSLPQDHYSSLSNYFRGLNSKGTLGETDWDLRKLTNCLAGVLRTSPLLWLAPYYFFITLQSGRTMISLLGL
jgi:hypothetical protein